MPEIPAFEIDVGSLSRLDITIHPVHKYLKIHK